MNTIENTENKLREFENDMRIYMETTSDCFWRWNMVTGDVERSVGFERKFGYSKKDISAEIEWWVDRLHPDDKDRVLGIFEDTCSKGLRGCSYEYRFRCKDGSFAIVEDHVGIIRDDEGNVIRSLGAMTDITQLRKQEERLHQHQKMDALGKLTSGVSHDFNNVLGVILGYSDLLHQLMENNPDILQYIDEISVAGLRAQKLTSKLLAFSHFTTSEPELVTIDSILVNSKLMLEKTLTARVKLNINLEKNLLPCKIDRSDFEDAILNISINALHAMPEGGIFTISAHNVFLQSVEATSLNIKPGNYVLVTFNDSGIGMDKETQDKMFEPFFTTKEENGTGLGMSQVYGFVNQSKGAITVNSEINQGTSIYIYLPSSTANVTNNFQENNSEDNTVLLGDETILVVDDEPSLVKLVDNILSANGYRVLTTSSGKEALKILDDAQIDLIITDVIMPEIDGYHLASEVIKNYPQTQVQLMSGFSDYRNTGLVDKEIIENILAKPFNSKHLLSRVRKLLDASVVNSESS